MPERIHHLLQVTPGTQTQRERGRQTDRHTHMEVTELTFALEIEVCREVAAFVIASQHVERVRVANLKGTPKAQERRVGCPKRLEDVQRHTRKKYTLAHHKSSPTHTKHTHTHTDTYTQEEAASTLIAKSMKTTSQEKYPRST